MTTMTEAAVWEPTVKQIDTTEDVLGGVEGPVNVQGLQLANRTQYLKQQVETLSQGLEDLDTAQSAALSAHSAANDTSFEAVEAEIFFFSQIL